MKNRLRVVILGISFVIIVFSFKIFSADESAGFSPEKANFEIKFKNEISSYRIMGVFALPGEILSFEINHMGKKGNYSFETDKGFISDSTIGKWKWKTPSEKGNSRIVIRNVSEPDSMILNVFTKVPLSEVKNGYLNGYNIGKYPDIPLKGLAIYNKPPGFIEVTEENEDTHISPHFTIKQFLSKQGGDYPKYLVLRERLVLKLELILEKVNAKGYDCNTLYIMSGYRTPYYNHAIGNVKYSRHVWGGAADIFIDMNPADDYMDDLNGDGIINYKDAGILYEIIDDMYGEPYYGSFWGGLGRYKKTNNHGPFIHIDVRGFRARWGD